MSILELILRQIKESYDEFVAKGCIENKYCHAKELMFKHLLDGDLKTTFLRVMKFNINNLDKKANKIDRHFSRIINNMYLEQNAQKVMCEKPTFIKFKCNVTNKIKTKVVY